MSRLDELIKELCPNGVEYRKVGDIADYEQPSKYLVKSTDYNEDFETPVLTAGQTFILGYTNETDGIYPASKDKPVIIFDDFTGAFKWVDFPFKAKSSAMKMITAKENVLIRYLYHLMGFLNYSSDEHKRLWISIYSEFMLPVPPLEVQREIVRILDSFTLLTAELTAELTARKKQYEFYRDELLKADSHIPMITLGEIATDIYRGSGIKRDQVTEDGVPCVRYGEIYTTYNTSFNNCVSHTQLEYVSNPKYFEHGDILFAITGESVEDIAKSIAYIGHEKCLAGSDIVVMKHKQNPRYLAHVLNTSMARQQKSKGKVKSKVVHSNVSSIEQIEIPLPSLEVQKRYADVLDNFEKICNDLNIGLPAEIEARQKQYEYYRDLLLTFAETGNTILTDRQTDRQTVIKLIQYVFGYIPVKLSEIATIIRGGNFQKKDFVENGKPCIHYGQMYTHFGIYADKTLTYLNDEVFAKSKIAKPGDIIMAVTSENVEDVCSCTAWLGNEEIAISGHTAIISHNQNAKYLSYYFHSAMFYKQKKKLAHGTKVIEVTPSKLADIEIMLPTLEEQERIVSILDRFDSLCNDLTSGLPAEIEARQKQYEYYRDKLLSFK
ncbi:restriction endonuclease subunit S [Catenibacterium mitsuokai]|uniref:restriction endonuclease subunit S n=1 Tax=Catenibacterium mitsuokai TaxID=100886 RepID=UPI003F8DF3BF